MSLRDQTLVTIPLDKAVGGGSIKICHLQKSAKKLCISYSQAFRLKQYYAGTKTRGLVSASCIASDAVSAFHHAKPIPLLEVQNVTRIF